MAGTTLNWEDCPRGGNKQALNPITLHILVENTWRQENYLEKRWETIVHLISHKTANWLQGIECISRYAHAASVSSVISSLYASLLQWRSGASSWSARLMYWPLSPSHHLTFIPKVEHTNSIMELSWLLWKYMATSNSISPKEADTPAAL